MNNKIVVDLQHYDTNYEREPFKELNTTSWFDFLTLSTDELREKTIFTTTKRKPVFPQSKNSAKEESNKIEYLDIKLNEKFLSIISEDTFEFGYSSNSEEFVKDLLEDNPMATREWLNALFLSNFHNEKVVIPILHILAHFDYAMVFPQGQTITLAALNHINIEVRECAIRAFENWSNPDSLKILKKIQCAERWLQDYVNQIINDLEEEFVHHAFSS